MNFSLFFLARSRRNGASFLEGIRTRSRLHLTSFGCSLSLFLGGWVLVVSGKIKSVESLIKCITFNQQQRRSKVYRQKFWQFHCPPELAWVGCRVIEYVWCSHWELKLLSKILSCFLLRDTNTNFHHLEHSLFRRLKNKRKLPQFFDISMIYLLMISLFSFSFSLLTFQLIRRSSAEN